MFIQRNTTFTYLCVGLTISYITTPCAPAVIGFAAYQGVSLSHFACGHIHKHWGEPERAPHFREAWYIRPLFRIFNANRTNSGSI